MRSTSIALVGSGNLAAALAPALKAAGYRIDEIVARNAAGSRQRARRLARQVEARAVTLEKARLQADVIWFCVTDDAIASAARSLAAGAEWRGKIALHSSGALTSDELVSLRRRGAAVASLHPMMTFVHGTAPSLAGVAFAVEGDPAAVRKARRIARALKGSVLTLRKDAKVLYHSVGSFSSPMVIAALATAERVARAAGIPARQAAAIMHPIVRRTIENYLERGAAAAFSGPITRADLNTIRRHLDALEKVPAARQAYVALVRSALLSLPVRNRKAVEKCLSSRRRRAKG